MLSQSCDEKNLSSDVSFNQVLHLDTCSGDFFQTKADKWLFVMTNSQHSLTAQTRHNWGRSGI